MNDRHFITSAYGSNMPTARIQERCPSARPIGIAQLAGFKLGWHKRSADGSGKCNIVRTDPDKTSIWGVLFEILRSEKRDLDRAEGLGYGYDQLEVEVAHQSVILRAQTYVATDIDDTLRPYTWYKALVVAGAREQKLPLEYLEELENVEATVDPDPGRHRRNLQIIGQ